MGVVISSPPLHGEGGRAATGWGRLGHSGAFVVTDLNPHPGPPCPSHPAFALWSATSPGREGTPLHHTHARRTEARGPAVLITTPRA